MKYASVLYYAADSASFSEEAYCGTYRKKESALPTYYEVIFDVLWQVIKPGCDDSCVVLHNLPATQPESPDTYPPLKHVYLRVL